MHGLGFQEYRQVATAFMEKHLKYNVDDPDDGDCMLDRQAGHSSRTAGMEYARSTEDHRQVGREEMHGFFLASNCAPPLLRIKLPHPAAGVSAAGKGGST